MDIMLVPEIQLNVLNVLNAKILVLFMVPVTLKFASDLMISILRIMFIHQLLITVDILLPKVLN